MKKSIKLVLVSIIAAIICLGYTGVVNATAEEDLISFLSKSFNVAGQSVKIPSGYVKEAQRYIDTYGVTDSEVAAIKSKVNEGVAIMNKEGVTDVTKLSKDSKNQLMSVAQEAGAVVGATVTFNTGTVTVTGEDGKAFGTFVTSSKTGNGSQTAFARTGNDATLYVVCGAAIIAVAGAIIYRKNKVNA